MHGLLFYSYLTPNIFFNIPIISIYGKIINRYISRKSACASLQKLIKKQKKTKENVVPIHKLFIVVC